MAEMPKSMTVKLDLDTEPMVRLIEIVAEQRDQITELKAAVAQLARKVDALSQHAEG